LKVEGEAAGGGDGNFNGRVDGRTGSKDSTEGRDQGFVGEATGDGDNERISQSVGGDVDSIESGTSMAIG